ncbi:MAG TPA: hypothetical protein ENJ53_09435 [Phaeodactylibacter sp.]|nr:hypothetical protein [Phaeodactylibacter sp.]
MKKAILFSLILGFLFFQCKNEQDIAPTVKNNDLIFVGTGSGCSTFLAFKLNEDRNIGLVVSGNRDSLQLDSTIQTYNLAYLNNLSVRIEQLSNGENFYCDDLLEQGESVLNTYEATQGIAKIQIVEDSINLGIVQGLTNEILYKINIHLENIKLQDANGDELIIQNEVFTNVLVGWLP